MIERRNLRDEKKSWIWGWDEDFPKKVRRRIRIGNMPIEYTGSADGCDFYQPAIPELGKAMFDFKNADRGYISSPQEEIKKLGRLRSLFNRIFG